MPPSAPAIGSATWEGCESSPSTTSRLISSPTSRKKIAIRPSLIHSTSGLLRPNAPNATVSLVPSKRSATQANGELASSRASTAAARSGSALPASLCNTAARRFMGAFIAKRPGLATRASAEFSSGGLFPVLAHEGHQELEQVDEVEVQAERAEDGDLLGRVRTPGV